MQGLCKKNLVKIALLAGIVLCLVAPASADYTFTTIKDPHEYSTDSAYGINNSGDIVGSCSDAGGIPYGFAYVGGNFATIDIYPQVYTTLAAYGINDAGNIVGSFVDNSGFRWGFLDVGGQFTTIDATDAYGINNSGHIVGVYPDAQGYLHGFLIVGDLFSTIDFPNAVETQTYGINDSDEIVGFYRDSNGVHGFLEAGGTFTTIDFPGGSNSQAYGINNSGAIVGVYADAKRVQHGFLDVAGSFVTIDFPGASSTQAHGINDAGQIVGQYTDTQRNNHAFLAILSSSGTVTTPLTPSGPATGITGNSYTYSTGGSLSSLRNPVEYQFDWKGDGSDLSAFGPAAQSKTWTAPGTYTVRARARDSVDTLAVSNWSSGLPVTISRDPNAPSISVIPPSYPFGNVKVKRSKAVSFIVKNSGTISYTISTSITGADASMFRITSGSGSRTIKPGKTLTIKVTFKPVSTGAKTSTLEVISNDPNALSVEVPLSGTGQ